MYKNIFLIYFFIFIYFSFNWKPFGRAHHMRHCCLQRKVPPGGQETLMKINGIKDILAQNLVVFARRLAIGRQDNDQNR